MFGRRGFNDAELAAIEAEGRDFAAELGLAKPLVREPSHRMVDLPPGAIAAVLYQDPNRTIQAIVNSLPASPTEADYTQAVRHVYTAMNGDPTIGPIYETIRTMNQLSNGGRAA
jgi:hypothetical protein